MTDSAALAVLSFASSREPALAAELELLPPPAGSQRVSYLLRLTPGSNGIDSLVAMGAGEITPETVADVDVVAAVHVEPSRAILLEAFGADGAVCTEYSGHSRLPVPASKYPAERIYTNLRENQDLILRGLRVSFTVDCENTQNLPMSSHYQSAPQLLVAHSRDFGAGSNSDDMLFTSPNQIPETLPEASKVLETPAVNSRYIDPNSSQRGTNRGGTPTKGGVQPRDLLVHPSSRDYKHGFLADPDQTTSESEDDRADPSPSVTEGVVNDRTHGAPPMYVTVATEPMAITGDNYSSAPSPAGADDDDVDLDETSTPFQTAPQKSGLADGEHDDQQDSLPPAFQLPKKTHTPGRRYGKSSVTPERKMGVMERALMNFDEPVVEDSQEDKVPVTSKKRARKVLPDDEQPVVTAKGRAGKRSRTTKSEEPITVRPRSAKRTGTRTSKGNQPAFRSASPASPLGTTQYTFSASENEGNVDAPAHKTPGKRNAKRKSLPSTNKKTTPASKGSTKVTTPDSPTLSTKTLRTKSLYTGPPPRIVFSNSTHAQSKPLLSFLRAHSGRVLSDPSEPACNFLVVGPGELKRTPKLTTAVARGTTVVEDTWLLESRAAGALLNPSAYVPVDPEREAGWGRTLATAIAAGARGENYVLHRMTVYFTAGLLGWLRKTPGQEEALVGVCRAAGAEVVKKSPRHDRADGEIVLGYGEDKEVEGLKKKYWQVYETHLVGESVMRGKLALGEEFKITRKKPGKK